MTEPPVHVLVVEDDQEDFLILQKMLSGIKKNGFNLERVSTYEEAMERLDRKEHQVCLLDYRLKGKNGLDFLKEAAQKGHSTPVIFVTGQGDHDVDLEAMQLGASDYLSKNKIDAAILERSIRYAIERKKAEDTLRHREEFSRAIIENALDGIAVVESGGNLRYLSPSVEWILGYPQGEKLAANLFDLVHPDDSSRVKEMMNQLLLSIGKVQKNEFQLRHKDGTWRVVEATGKSHIFTNPSFKGVVLNYRDVTERKNGERTTLRLAAIVESSNDAVYSVALEGVILSWNPGAERIYGYKADEIGGRDISMIAPDGYREEFKKLFETVRQGKAVSNFITTHQSKKKTPISVSLTISPIKDASGLVLRASVIARDISESEHARAVQETLLKERDILLERLQLYLERMPMAFILTDEHFNYTYWNPAAEKMFGYAFREVEGQNGILVSPGDLETAGKEMREAVLTGKSYRGKILNSIRKDGGIIPCEWYGTPLQDEEGRFSGMMSMAIDITERKKADESRTRLASTLEQIPDAVIALDLKGNIVDWNKGAENLYGYRSDEILGKSPSLLEPADGKGEIEKYWKEIAGGKEVIIYEAVRQRKNGELIDISATFSALKNEQGKIVGFSAIARNITERKKAAEVQAQLAAILQQTTDAVIGTDLEDGIFGWNQGAEKMFGYSLDEIVGQPADILAPTDRKHELAEMRAIVIAGESISNLETVRVKKNKELVDVSITMSPIKDSHGKTVGVSAITRDITDRKKAEESLWKSEEQMRRVEKMNAIGRLAGGVAHDFNNLLSVIGGNAEFLLSSIEKENPHREEVEEIQKAVQRGAGLTKQLLVFGQKQVVQPQPVNLNEVSAEMNKMLKRLIDATIDLAIIQDKNIQPILSDLGQMQQVILNLVLNARDAMPQGGHLIIETKMVEAEKLGEEQKPTLPPGSFVRLSVTDTGTGMSPEIQKHIFEPFFTTKAGKGTGLGLASVYGIVTKWSGHIFLHSTPGMGTTFSLYFPALPPGETVTSKPKQIALLTQGSETILVAEDEEPVRKILVRTLEKHGYKVLEAHNGIEAVQKAWSYRDPIHLLLTDAMMPKMNGKELRDELRKTRPKTKVLFVSGYPREVLSQQGILDSSIHLIQKPFEIDDLVRQIRKILDEK